VVSTRTVQGELNLVNSVSQCRYERGRPSYSQEVVDKLVATLQLDKSKTVLDLGAGTGKMTRLLGNS
jgi:cyclopropane fatty-acyl-phospholipid synthase-like methyltransferase